MFPDSAHVELLFDDTFISTYSTLSTSSSKRKVDFMHKFVKHDYASFTFFDFPC